jgi:hypothetical protein
LEFYSYRSNSWLSSFLPCCAVLAPGTSSIAASLLGEIIDGKDGAARTLTLQLQTISSNADDAAKSSGDTVDGLSGCLPVGAKTTEWSVSPFKDTIEG